jgi:hypothetical protein
MSIFTTAAGYLAHKTTKVAKGSGGTIKSFVSEVKESMKQFEALDEQRFKTLDDLPQDVREQIDEALLEQLAIQTGKQPKPTEH